MTLHKRLPSVDYQCSEVSTYAGNNSTNRLPMYSRFICRMALVASSGLAKATHASPDGRPSLVVPNVMVSFRTSKPSKKITMSPTCSNATRPCYRFRL